MLGLADVSEIKSNARKCIAIDWNILTLPLCNFADLIKYLWICKMDSQPSFSNKKKQSFKLWAMNLITIILQNWFFFFTKLTFYMTQFQTASKIYGSIWFCLTVVIKETTNLPLIIDYIQSTFKVTYVFSLLATL